MIQTHLADDEDPPQDVLDAENRAHSWDGNCYAAACQRRNPENDWTCTRAPGHASWHVAHDRDILYAWWAQEHPDCVRVPEGL